MTFAEETAILRRNLRESRERGAALQLENVRLKADVKTALDAARAAERERDRLQRELDQSHFPDSHNLHEDARGCYPCPILELKRENTRHREEVERFIAVLDDMAVRADGALERATNEHDRRQFGGMALAYRQAAKAAAALATSDKQTNCKPAQAEDVLHSVSAHAYCNAATCDVHGLIHAAQEAAAHFGYLFSVGALTREEEPYILALRAELQPATNATGGRS